MAARKRKTVDPLAKAVKDTVRSKGYTTKGQPTKAAQKAADEAVRNFRQQQVARMATFESDYYDPSTDSFSSLENLRNPDHPEYDPDTYNEILASSGIDPAFLQDVGLAPVDVTGAKRDIAAGTSEDLGDIEDYEDIENQDLAGTGLVSRAVSDVLGPQPRGTRRSFGPTTKGLEEGGAAARTPSPARSAQPAAPTSSRRSTAIPRAKTVGELVAEQRFWSGETRSGKPQRPFVQPQALTTKDSGKDLGVSAITSTPQAREAREENKVRRMVGTFNELVARTNKDLGLESGSPESMTIPVEGSAPTAQVEQRAVTPPTPGRVIRSSNAANRPMASRDGVSTMSLADVTGASDLQPEVTPVPGRPSGPRRMRINRAASGDTAATGAANPSGMPPQLQKFLRDNQLGGIIGPGSRSGGALLKGADAITRRVGGTALGAVVGSWDVGTDRQTGQPKPADTANPATQVTQTDSGAFELVNPLKEVRDPMDPEYTPYTNSPQIPVRDVSGLEGEQKVREIQAAILKKGKPASFTGRRPSKRKDPLPGPTVMEQTNVDEFGSDVAELAKQQGISRMDAARRLAAADELRKRKEDVITEGTEAVTTSGEDLNILRERRGTSTSVKGQMTRVPKAGGGTVNVRTNIPTADELVEMFPQKAGEEVPAYADRLSTYLIPKRTILSPEDLAKRDADLEATKKAERQKGMPKAPSKAEQARSRKAVAKRIAEDEAPRQAYKSLREGPNAETDYDTAGFVAAHEMDPYALGAKMGGATGPNRAMLTGDAEAVTSRMLGADVEQFEVDQTGIPARSITGALLKPSSDADFNKRYVVSIPTTPPKDEDKPTGGPYFKEVNPTGNPYFKNVNDIQFNRSAGYTSQASTLASPIPTSTPAPQEQSQEQRMENIRRADALVAGKRSGAFARMPLEGESMSDMARRVSVGSLGMARRGAPQGGTPQAPQLSESDTDVTVRASGVAKRRGMGINQLNSIQFGQ